MPLSHNPLDLVTNRTPQTRTTDAKRWNRGMVSNRLLFREPGRTRSASISRLMYITIAMAMPTHAVILRKLLCRRLPILSRNKRRPKARTAIAEQIMAPVRVNSRKEKYECTKTALSDINRAIPSHMRSRIQQHRRFDLVNIISACVSPYSSLGSSSGILPSTRNSISRLVGLSRQEICQAGQCRPSSSSYMR